jgi:hypothetical protein
MQGQASFSGTLTAKVRRARRAPWVWWIRNTLRIAFLWGWLANLLARAFSALTGIPTITAELRARVIKASGEVIDYGVLSFRLVTDAGVAFLVDDWDDDSEDITNMNYHASGTDNTAENVTDTALGAEATTVTNRGTGVKSQPAANQLRSIATQSFTGAGAIVEHGLFSVVTESAGVLWDRSIFTVINVGNGDSIQWTYTCTVSSGS